MKKIAMKIKAILLAAVLVWLSPARAQQRHPMPPEQRAAKITEWMKTNLQLNDEQLPKVDEINKKYAMKTEDVRKEMKEQNDKTAKKEKMSSLKALDKEKDGELKVVLTDEQFKNYLAKKEEMKEQIKGKMKEHKGKQKS